jgi:hypothetical protein
MGLTSTTLVLWISAIPNSHCAARTIFYTAAIVRAATAKKTLFPAIQKTGTTDPPRRRERTLN